MFGLQKEVQVLGITITVDFTGIQYMTKEFDVPIIFDATHCVQKQVVVIHLMVIESMLV